MQKIYWKNFGKIVFSGLIGVMLALSVFSQSEAQTTDPTPTPIPLIEWSSPIRFDEPGWFPDLTTDISGGIHLAWSSADVINEEEDEETNGTLAGYDTVLYTYSQDGTQWKMVNDVVAVPMTAGSYVTRPALLTDEFGGLHMTYRIVEMYYTQVKIDDADEADTWTSPYRVSSGQLSYFSRLIKDSTGRIHLIYTENVLSEENEYAITFHVFHRYSDDNGQNWSIRSDISSYLIGAAKPQVILDDKDHLHVVWEAGSGGSLGMVQGPTQLFYSNSSDHGETWSAPFEFATPSITDGRNITIGVDGSGVLLVTWLSTRDNKVYYQFSTDGGRFWSSAEEIPGIYGAWSVFNNAQDGYSMTTDSDGRIHFVLTGNQDSGDDTVDVLHLIWHDYNWVGPYVIADYLGDIPQWPRIVISNGNKLNAAWYVRGEGEAWDSETSANYHIWFSQAESAASYQKPDFWPTETAIPTFTPTPQPSATMTPTQLPAEMIETPILDNIGEDAYSENDELLVLAKSVLPTAAFLILVLIAIRFVKSRR